MQLPPSPVIATFPPANFVDPESHVPAVSVVNLVLLPWCIFIVGLRTYARLRVSKSFGADDILSIASLIPVTAFCVISTVAELRFLVTRHLWDIPLDYAAPGLRMVLAAECLFNVACSMTKISMLVFVRRMTENTASKVRTVALVAIVAQFLQGLIFCLVIIFQCNPISDYWKLSSEPQPNCISEPAHLLAAGILNTITDFVVVVIPIPVVLRLRLPVRQQLSMICLFSAGFMVCIVGCVRTAYLYEVSQTYDQTWASFRVWVSAAVEMYVAVLCASLPALKPLFTKYLPRVLDSIPSTLDISKRRSAMVMRSPTPDYMKNNDGHGLRALPKAHTQTWPESRRTTRMTEIEILRRKYLGLDSDSLYDDFSMKGPASSRGSGVTRPKMTVWQRTESALSERQFAHVIAYQRSQEGLP